MGTKSEDELTSEMVVEFTVDELREFLEADLLDVPADPEFKERLRQRLWALVSARAVQRQRKPDSNA